MGRLSANVFRVVRFRANVFDEIDLNVVALKRSQPP
jgi:hypothetical protein